MKNLDFWGKTCVYYTVKHVKVVPAYNPTLNKNVLGSDGRNPTYAETCLKNYFF